MPGSASGFNMFSNVYTRISQAALFSTIVYFMSLNCTEAHIYFNLIGVCLTGRHDVAEKVASDTGLKNLGQIGSLEGCYLLEIPHRRIRSALPCLKYHAQLEEHDQVLWFEQQRQLFLKLRDFQPRDMAGQMGISDPFWEKQWHLNGGAFWGFDMNVLDVWRKGFTGKNVVDPSASYDMNSNDDDPMPQYDPSNKHSHGTRCAGVIAAELNNTKCIVGIAPDARIGVQRAQTVIGL